MNLKEHWNNIYRTKALDDLSWFEVRPAMSLKLIEATGVRKDDDIIDVGGGVSLLVDCLMEAGFKRLAVLDISAAALNVAKQRLDGMAGKVEWLEADVTQFTPLRRFSLWHDRAVFHFLREKKDRQQYVERLKQSLTPEGHVIIATFAVHGPLKCSGLDVVRYDGPSISGELGAEFHLLEQREEVHVTPWNTEQKFTYFRFRRKAAKVG